MSHTQNPDKVPLMEAEWTRVSAFVLCHDSAGRILLTRFAHSGHPDHGKWTLPGGGMEWGEVPEETARREFLEETGLEVTVGGLAGVFSYWITAKDSVRGEAGHFVGIVFEGEAKPGDMRTEFDPDNTTDAAEWFPIEELDAVPRVPLVDFAVSLSSTARE